MSRRRALLAGALLALLALGGAAQKTEAPACCGPIVPRSEWRAQESNCDQRLSLPVLYVVVSHTAGSTCDSPASCLQQVRNVQHYHTQTLQWCDVAYNFLIGEDGLVYEGRGWHTKGNHAGTNWNAMSIGISFMGNYMERVPPPRALRAAKNLLACGVAQGVLRPDYQVKGHRDVQKTLSPGDQLYRIIQQWPQYE
ncbi:PREDICTED: peptidoglycan recognition protein 1 [Propithecus coquereli]|uniref:Peptidoglycan-recognition protein n=1 Tax=Propithecus coquereli TaxID=379532 RepID=A0A2K6GSD8_PROCO|nr:PREDICTED: peptidoglycan recognition protein 1 [Propithecus coquereli]